MELGGGFEPPERTKKDHTKNSQIPPSPPKCPQYPYVSQLSEHYEV